MPARVRERRPRPPFRVGELTLTFVDHTRTVQFPGSPPEPRTVVTIVRYPATGRASPHDFMDAPPARPGAPFPLVIFGHGFAVTPAIYAALLHDWAQAGYVVAAPIFPAGNANAPGGPNERDLVNQPADMSFVIDSLLSLSRRQSGPLAALIDRRRIAVSGQSDGGDTALAVAYDPRFRDRRLRAAMILSGAEIPYLSTFTFASGEPPLLAIQGTADTINPPPLTYQFFAAARTPKYLLMLLGAQHLGPYTDERPQLSVVERVSIEFLDHYLKSDPRALSAMVRDGDVSGVSILHAYR